MVPGVEPEDPARLAVVVGAEEDSGGGDRGHVSLLPGAPAWTAARRKPSSAQRPEPVQEDTTPVAAWLYYFRVDDCKKRHEAATKAGAKATLYGPMEVPGGDIAALMLDAQGAVFGITSTP